MHQRRADGGDTGSFDLRGHGDHAVSLRRRRRRLTRRALYSWTPATLLSDPSSQTPTMTAPDDGVTTYTVTVCDPQRVRQ